jgi:hypothetical protein
MGLKWFQLCLKVNRIFEMQIQVIGCLVRELCDGKKNYKAMSLQIWKVVQIRKVVQMLVRRKFWIHGNVFYKLRN